MARITGPFKFWSFPLLNRLINSELLTVELEEEDLEPSTLLKKEGLSPSRESIIQDYEVIRDDEGEINHIKLIKEMRE